MGQALAEPALYQWNVMFNENIIILEFVLMG